METEKAFNIKEAAKILGVSPSTLRLWDRLGKVKIRRNRINNHRVFTESDLKDLLSMTREKNGSGLDQTA